MKNLDKMNITAKIAVHLIAVALFSGWMVSYSVKNIDGIAAQTCQILDLQASGLGQILVRAA